MSTSYDSIAIAPQLSKGISQLSGMFAMKEISKAIQELNNAPDLGMAEKQRYDIMFVLTPGSPYDYEVTNNFVQTMNQVVAERIKLVICLDSLS